MSLLILLAMAALVIFAFWNASKCQANHDRDYEDRESENFEAVPLGEKENFGGTVFNLVPIGDVGSKIWETLYYANENYHLL